MKIDLVFPVSGGPIPGEHQYLLLSALSHRVPSFHDSAGEFRFAPINGERLEPGLLHLLAGSRLRVRLPAEKIAVVLPLTGKSLSLGREHAIQLEVPTVMALIPAPTLAARIVTFKHAREPARFLDVAAERLREQGIQGEPQIPITEKGGHAGEPRRQVIRIKGKRIIGYALRVTGLTAEESIRLQEAGLGGRTRMGCGFFTPYRARG